MSSYKFSTVKIIPDLARYEPVNVGVILHDVGNARIYRRFTNNWAEFKRRTGIEYMPHADGPGVAKDGDYLDALASETGRDSLEVTKPKPVPPIKAPQEMLDALFRIQISLPEKRLEKGSTTSNTLQEFRSSLCRTIRKMGFPERSYEPGYAFKATVVDREFTCAFLKGGFPRLCVECLSFSAGNVLRTTKSASSDIELVRKSQRKSGSLQTDFRIFSEQDRDEVDTADERVRKSLEVLELSGIEAVYKKDRQCELDKILKAVSAMA